MDRALVNQAAALLTAAGFAMEALARARGWPNRYSPAAGMRPFTHA